MAERPIEYCPFCGTRLEHRYHEEEKRKIPFCTFCGDWRFPRYNAAVVMVIFNEVKDRMLMVKQHHEEQYYLVAGYIDEGETAEHAVVREIREETGLHVTGCRYSHSHYYEPSNTLMFCYEVTVAEGAFVPNEEVDEGKWFDPGTVMDSTVPKHSLAVELLTEAGC